MLASTKERKYEFTYYHTIEKTINKESPLGFNFKVSIEKTLLSQENLIPELIDIKNSKLDDLFFHWSPPIGVQIAKNFGDMCVVSGDEYFETDMPKKGAN